MTKMYIVNQDHSNKIDDIFQLCDLLLIQKVTHIQGSNLLTFSPFRERKTTVPFVTSQRQTLHYKSPLCRLLCSFQE